MILFFWLSNDMKKIESILNAVEDIKNGSEDKCSILDDLHAVLLECLTTFID